MRFRTLTIAAALSAGISTTGDAYAPQKSAEPPVVAAGRAPRLHRDVTFTAPHGALAGLPSWRVMWDRDTDVPLRLWGPSIAAPGTSTNGSAAEAFARQQLAQHIDLLAPGATVADFVLVSNQLNPSGDVRSVGFVQYAQGLPVIGGAVGFTFSHDRLVMMSSTALPRVVARAPQSSLPLATVASAARSWLASAGHDTEVKAHEQRVIIPVVRSRGTGGPSIEYRVAETVVVESTRQPGTWSVWIDANDASPVARRTHLHWASGKVLFDTPDRYPAGTRSPKPAAGAQHTVGGAQAMSALDGSVTWASGGSVSVAPGLVGPTIRVANKQGALVTDTLTLVDGGTVTWSKATEEFADAQLTAFVATSMAKQFTREKLNAELAWLDTQIPVTVNEAQTCNAYSTGHAIHFFRRSNQCENTARLVDVVYHEFGHSLHAQSVIPGVGSFDSSLSEGLADTLSAAITRDPGMGRGFFHSNAPLRHLDPAGYEKKWPDDADGQPHNEGEIIGGTLWDLRKALEAKLGVEAGDAQLRKIFYGIMQRASDIPSSYLEALVADDNDGNLANGTPNQCEINTAFGAHGLADPSVTLGLEPPVREGYRVSIKIPPRPQSDCPPPAVTGVTVLWTPASGFGGEVALTAADDTWAGQIPTQPDGTVIKYKVTVTLADGSSLSYPQNKADPEYQMYIGNVEKIWCADFEGGLGDWTVGGTPTQRVEWEVGPPMGIAGDPTTAYSGNNVLGIDLGGDDGLYAPRTTQFVESPEIDLAGHTNVRLQYYRWLNVEDGIFDPAIVQVNGLTVWQNKTGTSQNEAGTSHTDREWRFHDIDVAQHTAGGKLKVKFQITSDEGLEFGGWTVDDVCLVIPGAPSDHCGNGNLDGEEACDDGNSIDGDGCSATCELEDGQDGGCCSAGTNPAGPLALALMTLGVVIRRRRRR
jgi:MYXO-CTERM domain-containing protein